MTVVFVVCVYVTHSNNSMYKVIQMSKIQLALFDSDQFHLRDVADPISMIAYNL